MSEIQTTGLIPPSNALAEAIPESLSELFATDPEQLDPAKPDGQARLKRMVEALRRMYANWQTQEQQTKTKPRAKLAAPTKSSGPISGDLDF